MPKIIDHYKDATWNDNFRNNYCVWKFGKPKHNYYVKNRHSDTVTLDQYDQYILENLSPGSTIIYDAAGYYLKDAVENLTVIELNPIVRNWFPEVIIDTGEKSVNHLYSQADNFIVNNTIKLRWKYFEEYTEYWLYQRRFFKPGTHIFFSFRDIFIFHNRLKYNLSDLLNTWLQSMQGHGFELVKLQHDLIPVTADITNLNHVPEISDPVNGNIKIHWRYQP